MLHPPARLEDEAGLIVPLFPLGLQYCHQRRGKRLFPPPGLRFAYVEASTIPIDFIEPGPERRYACANRARAVQLSKAAALVLKPQQARKSSGWGSQNRLWP